MPSGNAIRRKLSKKVIDKMGVDTVLLRVSGTVEKDAYGEPVTSPWPFDSFPIRIVVDQDKREGEMTDIGALPDKKRDFLYFYCKGDFDIRIGDKIVYPAGSTTQWLVDLVVPTVISGVPVIIEAKAYRDARY